MENNNFTCEKCNYTTNIKSSWLKHLTTELHQNGIRKKRSDCKEPFKCEKCNYLNKNIITLKKHFLNEHADKQQREKDFKFYCSECDVGTFSIDTYNIHLNTNKHKKIIERLK